MVSFPFQELIQVIVTALYGIMYIETIVFALLYVEIYCFCVIIKLSVKTPP